jgi:hypothetical protein
MSEIGRAVAEAAQKQADEAPAAMVQLTFRDPQGRVWECIAVCGPLRNVIEGTEVSLSDSAALGLVATEIRVVLP